MTGLISSVFHLDNSLQDGKGVMPEVTLNGNARFDDSNLGWMETPAGAALRFNGFNDRAEVTFSVDPYLPADRTVEDIDEVSIEGRFYFDTIDMWDENRLELLFMRQSWDSGVEIRRNSWMTDLSAYLGSYGDSGECGQHRPEPESVASHQADPLPYPLSAVRGRAGNSQGWPTSGDS